ncbi:unnamed protein product, partial [Polarella glacialis]
EDAVASFRRLGDERSEAALQHLCAQAYMQRFADEEKSREARGMRQPSASQDPREAVRSALRARALFRQLGDATSELQVLDTLARAHLAKRDVREGLRTAEEALAMARKARDKVAEANSMLLCSSGQAEEGRLAQALRSAETAQSLFRALGHDDGLKESDRFIKALSEAARASGYREPGGIVAGQRGRSGVGAFSQDLDQGQLSNKGSGKGSLLTGQRGNGRSQQHVDPSTLYNRRAFPWTPQQAANNSDGAEKKQGI